MLGEQAAAINRMASPEDVKTAALASERRVAVGATAAESRRAVDTRSAPGNAPGAASTGSEAGTRSTGTVATEESAGSETEIERGTGVQSTGDVRGRVGVVGRFVNRGFPSKLSSYSA